MPMNSKHEYVAVPRELCEDLIIALEEALSAGQDPQLRELHDRLWQTIPQQREALRL